MLAQGRGGHSRITEEVILWATAEFGYVTLAEAWSTGSSIMPQKKNPDVAELARGKAGRLVGNLAGLMTSLKALPLASNRDLQEDKEPLFDSAAQLAMVLPAMAGMIRTLEVPHRPSRRARPGGLHAGHRPRRVAGAPGRAVPSWPTARRAPASARPRPATWGSTSSPTPSWPECDPALTPDVRAVLTVAGSIASRDTHGGTAPERLSEQLDRIFAAAIEAHAWAGRPIDRR